MTARRWAFGLARRLYAIGPRVPALLIMGHMRSGSTLLLHLLLTNPGLIACGERNTPYRSHRDLDSLALAARIAQRAPFRAVRYAVDQINHDALTPSRDLLGDARVRLIFLCREPLATVRSILELDRAFYGGTRTVEQTVDYYCSRLRTLAGHAANVESDNKAMATDYDTLIDEPTAELERLRAFLGLDAPFAEHYATQPFTGTRGDPSEKIRAGRIVREREALDYEVHPELLGRAEGAYREYRQAVDCFIA